MCGIAGYINPEGIKKADIRRMNSSLRHRGPDDSGIYIDEHQTVGLGHRRLSIIDLAGGQQPISNEDGSLWITFNGEIYNFHEIKEGLEKRHQFKTNSDTEVILHLYEEKGIECLKYFRGMFAFAIYNDRDKTLFAARDHLGQKPFYYHHENDEFAFASEVKALLALKPELRELNCEALYEYLSIRIITPPRSMFSRIKKLPPGHFLIFNDGKVEINKYWHLKYQPKMAGSFNDVVSELEEQLLSVVKYHLVSDVPVGALLSGGMDSSLIVAMISKVSDEPFKTFAGGVPYENYSELPTAKIVADKFRTEHFELTINPSLVRTLPDLVSFLDEPSDPLSVCMYNIAELVRRKVKVVLGGDGGDELFGGYDRYYGNVFASYYAMIPESLRKHVFEKMLNMVPEGFWYKSVSHQLKWMHQMSFYQDSERYAKSLNYFYFSDIYKQELYTDSFRKSVGLFEPEACIRDYFDSGTAEEVIDKMLYADSMTRMPDHPVMITDRMTMAHGLEARSPFLDHKLAEFCATIPSKFKVRGTKLRIIQTELARRHLPSEIVTKKKQGFSSPLTYMLADEFKLLYKLFLSDSMLVRAGYLNKPAIGRLLDEHFGNKTDHGNRLWLLCNAEIWYRMFIEKENKDSLMGLLSSCELHNH